MGESLVSTGIQSSLDPAGTQADAIASLWWIYFWVLIVIFILVVICTCIAFARTRRVSARQEIAAQPVLGESSNERRILALISGCVAATVVILFVLLFVDIFASRTVYGLSAERNPLSLKVIGHQWWWEVQYQDPADPSKTMTTANELHVPVGKVVRIELSSPDVIHSFWVPNITGKKDLIPGHPTKTWLKADRPGTFRGQCAEFCHQHAHMRFDFVAEPPGEFEHWLTQARQNAHQPSNPAEQRGQNVFMSNQCVMCHNIEGTPARATVGPDLTHFASRKLIAAGSFPNTRGYLAGWIANPQNVKPGVRMPPNALSSDDLNALVTYLESLK